MRLRAGLRQATRRTRHCSEAAELTYPPCGGRKRARNVEMATDSVATVNLMEWCWRPAAPVRPGDMLLTTLDDGWAGCARWGGTS